MFGLAGVPLCVTVIWFLRSQGIPDSYTGSVFLLSAAILTGTAVVVRGHILETYAPRFEVRPDRVVVRRRSGSADEIQWNRIRLLVDNGKSIQIHHDRGVVLANQEYYGSARDVIRAMEAASGLRFVGPEAAPPPAPAGPLMIRVAMVFLFLLLAQAIPGIIRRMAGWR